MLRWFVLFVSLYFYCVYLISVCCIYSFIFCYHIRWSNKAVCIMESMVKNLTKHFIFSESKTVNYFTKTVCMSLPTLACPHCVWLSHRRHPSRHGIKCCSQWLWCNCDVTATATTLRLWCNCDGTCQSPSEVIMLSLLTSISYVIQVPWCLKLTLLNKTMTATINCLY